MMRSLTPDDPVVIADRNGRHLFEFIATYRNRVALTARAAVRLARFTWLRLQLAAVRIDRSRLPSEQLRSCNRIDVLHAARREALTTTNTTGEEQ